MDKELAMELVKSNDIPKLHVSILSSLFSRPKSLSDNESVRHFRKCDSIS